MEYNEDEAEQSSEEDWLDTKWSTADSSALSCSEPKDMAGEQKSIAACDTENSASLGRDGSNQLMSRMQLNDNKAGMEGLDKVVINQIIYEASKGSKFFENEKKKEEQVQHRIQEQEKCRQKITEAELKRGLDEADKLISQLKANLDLSQTIVHVDMDAFYAAVEMRDDHHSVINLWLLGALECWPSLLESKSLETDVQMLKSVADVSETTCRVEENSFRIIKSCLNAVSSSTNSHMLSSSLDPQSSAQDTEIPAYEVITFGTDVESAVQEMRCRIEQRTLLTASAGIASNMMLAKVCSDQNKPNGQFFLPPDYNTIMEFVCKLPIRKISGIGRVTEQLLRALGITHCSDLYCQRALLYHLYSSVSFNYFMRIACGIGSVHVARFKLFIICRTFRELSQPKELYSKCLELCQNLASDLASKGLLGKTVSLKLKTVDFQVRTRAHTLSSYTNDSETIFSVAKSILQTEIQAELPKILRLRLMGKILILFSGILTIVSDA
ncbi:hypothetical protein C0Q70_20451 [Pomacea canaliculata]|uniref:DNA-directed DNA polymerase n=1 Tax=Pomacea canaliculata TaxID=400727 RepID=A0A2T7NFJ6_POMCA|nr:hypothetical protein C0Q70_20451 [Pomacea canaliculata]